MDDIVRKLEYHAQNQNLSKYHLSAHLKETNRFSKFSRKIPGFLYDFSHQRLVDDTLEVLFEHGRQKNVLDRFKSMTLGEKINHTENRAALHTAMRDFSDRLIFVDGIEVTSQIKKVRTRIKEFSEKFRSGKFLGTTGKPLDQTVVVGIGGSYLGTECVANALSSYARQKNNLHFLSNVDPADFARVAAQIDPEKALWIIVSKSYTTRETLANENLIRWFLKKNALNPADHMATVTSMGSPGDNPDNPVVASFHMFDFIGGRYSVTSAVGGVPLSIYLGYDIFERFLKGANEMDQHAASAPVCENIPLIAALLSIWNKDYLGYPVLGIIPYSTPLRRLPAHIQQLHMESTGKNVDIHGKLLEKPAGMIIIGEPGTNAQHSFFQMAHQGPAFPIEFIGVIQNPCHEINQTYKGITNHQELWANLIAQPKALAEGHSHSDKSRFFPGNRPSSTIILDDLSPESVGRLIAFYEAKTAFEAFLWNVNPFDQFGVQLGKTIAGTIREKMASRNSQTDEIPADLEPDPMVKAYLDLLF